MLRYDNWTTVAISEKEEKEYNIFLKHQDEGQSETCGCRREESELRAEKALTEQR